MRPVSDELQSGLFSTFRERERERDALEAIRAQWRRELDEQMALKRKQKASVKNFKTPDESCKAKLQPATEEGFPSQSPRHCRPPRGVPLPSDGGRSSPTTRTRGTAAVREASGDGTT
ncbi:coiled-coil domain-containing protein 66-like isoform X2 [Myxocyprinus asiaticus]|uniref:coiled-coil domain-containing protein 66-like isoform X2 n=1 Tax=Myxocyprinus asiaticus TaxID=70543 RepID=UPI002221FAEE|nr:coiled-coil domain-containing protein 66-like isoform X2 [Myxocyprinus asiaticus]